MLISRWTEVYRPFYVHINVLTVLIFSSNNRGVPGTVCDTRQDMHAGPMQPMYLVWHMAAHYFLTEANGAGALTDASAVNVEQVGLDVQ